MARELSPGKSNMSSIISRTSNPPNNQPTPTRAVHVQKGMQSSQMDLRQMKAQMASSGARLPALQDVQQLHSNVSLRPPSLMTNNNSADLPMPDYNREIKHAGNHNNVSGNPVSWMPRQSTLNKEARKLVNSKK